jgi:hypothetical protein
MAIMVSSQTYACQRASDEQGAPLALVCNGKLFLFIYTPIYYCIYAQVL